MLKPPRRGGYNEYPQSMFRIKNKKNVYTPTCPSFSIQKWGIRGVYISRTCFPDERDNQMSQGVAFLLRLSIYFTELKCGYD